MQRAKPLTTQSPTSHPPALSNVVSSSQCVRHSVHVGHSAELSTPSHYIYIFSTETHKTLRQTVRRLLGCCFPFSCFCLDILLLGLCRSIRRGAFSGFCQMVQRLPVAEDQIIYSLYRPGNLTLSV